MSTPKRILLAASLLLATTAGVSLAETPHLGKPLDEAAIANWDISILPDGTGLPKGSGTSAQGAVDFCREMCGLPWRQRQGRRRGRLVNDRKIAGISASQKTIKNFWPYATTIFDFIRRAMPFTAPRSLSDDEVYALTAYILAENKLIDANDTMNAETLPKVKMPNRDNFIIRFPDRI